MSCADRWHSIASSSITIGLSFPSGSTISPMITLPPGFRFHSSRTIRTITKWGWSGLANPRVPPSRPRRSCTWRPAITRRFSIRPMALISLRTDRCSFRDACRSKRSRLKAAVISSFLQARYRREDSPVGYSPPVGPAVFPVIAYNDLDDSKPVGTPMFSNVGRMWSINWIAYAELTWRPITINGNTTFIPDFPVVVHVPGGGTEVNHSTAPNDRSFARVTISTDGVLCTRTLPDGTRQLFNTGTFLGPAFLDQLIDPSGNTLSFTYDLNLRLVAVTDAIGQVTTLDYTWPGDIRKVTKITDPFGRFATFPYSGNSNELSSVTDELGLTTTFSYDSN